jgi:hypothetical protein
MRGGVFCWLDFSPELLCFRASPDLPRCSEQALIHQGVQGRFAKKNESTQGKEM